MFHIRSGKSLFKLPWSFWLFFPVPPSRNFTSMLHNLVPSLWTNLLNFSVMPDPSGPSFCKGAFPVWHLPSASFVPTLQHLTKPCNTFPWKHAPNADWGVVLLDLLPSPYSGILLLTEPTGFASQDLLLAKLCCVLSHFPLTYTCFITFSLYILLQSIVADGGRQVVCSCLLLSLNANSKGVLVASPHGLSPAWDEHGVLCHRYKNNRGWFLLVCHTLRLVTVGESSILQLTKIDLSELGFFSHTWNEGPSFSACSLESWVSVHKHIGGSILSCVSQNIALA